VTVYRSAADLPPFEDYGMAGRTYRYFKGQPQFPFGFGLSYSSMRYDALELRAREVQAGEDIVGSVRVTNIGSRPGEEVVQVYLGYPDSNTAPLRALAAFQRVRLQAGESRRVPFVITPRQMSVVDREGRRAVMPGRVLLYAGGGPPGNGPAGTATLQSALTITGEQPLPR
jgi:beta-glucosidase